MRKGDRVGVVDLRFQGKTDVLYSVQCLCIFPIDARMPFSPNKTNRLNNISTSTTAKFWLKKTTEKNVKHIEFVKFIQCSVQYTSKRAHKNMVISQSEFNILSKCERTQHKRKV